ncbi:YceI family protein [Yeosuana sp. AK3]|nr:YceI family protein [Flavobacteriia bacterium]NCP04919.1 YceI family protein [Flavobacteriales bacterium]PIV95204.1 MAG: YceI family protein [Flavobacteriaceae bacterium CG17_big_fil_post_rev_8_21_14_2_50_33_15]PIY11716.1 MAG: YceI family protein [Flavobacteriaceae bacterium CG_4_10_14_3_um_filter_33_47]PJB16965.1 MAG: YceI family protein [Flavobacteriaceae bacterium CG_4_9_14_3_um_filter_33_16]
MKKVILSMIAMVFISLTTFAQKQVSSKTHIKFFSTTPAENIEANNYASVSTLDTASGDIVFSVPMQSFEFEKALMQEHFNGKKFLNTKANPKAKLTGKIENIASLDFSKDGTYTADVAGELTINGVAKPINEKATITVKEGKVSLNSKFNVTLADHEVAFKGGKPATNIAKTVEVTVEAEY